MSSIIIKHLRGRSSKPSDLTDNAAKPGRVKNLTGIDDLSTICLSLKTLNPGRRVQCYPARADFFRPFQQESKNDDFLCGSV